MALLLQAHILYAALRSPYSLPLLLPFCLHPGLPARGPAPIIARLDNRRVACPVTVLPRQMLPLGLQPAHAVFCVTYLIIICLDHEIRVGRGDLQSLRSRDYQNSRRVGRAPQNAHDELALGWQHVRFWGSRNRGGITVREAKLGLVACREWQARRDPQITGPLRLLICADAVLFRSVRTVAAPDERPLE